MATLKEFEEALKSYNMVSALAVLEQLRTRDKAKRIVAPARRVVGRKMTPDLAQAVLELHRTTSMTQQEIAFKVGVNQGRVNEVIKHGKWLSGNSAAPEAIARDKALKRLEGTAPKARKPTKKASEASPARRHIGQTQLLLGDL